MMFGPNEPARVDRCKKSDAAHPTTTKVVGWAKILNKLLDCSWKATFRLWNWAGSFISSLISPATANYPTKLSHFHFPSRCSSSPYSINLKAQINCTLVWAWKRLIGIVSGAKRGKVSCSIGCRLSFSLSNYLSLSQFVRSFVLVGLLLSVK